MDLKRFFSFRDIDLKTTIADTLSGYGRRHFEKIYDWAAQTVVIERVKQLNPVLLQIVEKVVYVGASVVEQQLAPTGLAGQTVMGVFTDTGPEMMKRIINGSKQAAAAQATAAGNRRLAETILELDDTALERFSTAVLALDPEARQRLLAHLQQFDPEAQLRLAQLSPELLRQQAELFQAPAPEPLQSHDTLPNTLRERIKQKRLAAQARKKQRGIFKWKG